MNYFINYMLPLGYEIAVVCNYGLESATITLPNGVKLYPGGNDPLTREATLPWAAREFEPDVVLSLYDVWPLKFPSDPDFTWDWIAWTPIDSSPVSYKIIDKLMLADGIIAYSRFGQKAISKAGLESHYIPHGIPTDLFIPGDRSKAREAIGLPQDKFILGMVGANSFHPSRKSIAETLVAFSRFHSRYPDTALYLHMLVNEERAGVDIQSMQSDLNIGHAVYWAHQGGIRLGMPLDHMVTVYQALDVLVLPSLGEGFGIPVIEAQSCGISVIGNDCTTFPELVVGGWLTAGQPFRTAYRNWWQMPFIDSIVNAMEAAYRSFHDRTEWRQRQQTARKHMVARYDFGRVVAPMFDVYFRSWKNV